MPTFPAHRSWGPREGIWLFNDISALDDHVRPDGPSWSVWPPGDVSALDRLVDGTLMFTTLEGAVVGKQDDLAAHRARRLRLTRLEPTEQRLNRYGASAVVSVRMEIAGTWDGAAVAGAFRYTRVWVEGSEGWLVVAGHMSAVQA